MNRIFQKIINEGRQPLEYEVYQFFEEEGLKFPEYYVFSDLEDLESKLGDMPDTKYACKVMSPKILHKSDLKAVKLNVHKDELPAVFFDLKKRFETLDFNSVLIVPMADDGVELLVGSTKDPTFGTITVFGVGGTLVEILKDVTFGTSPLSMSDAELMIDSIKNQDLLNGPRGLPATNRRELAEFIVTVSTISNKYEGVISEIDINPLRVTDKGLIPLDARVIFTSDLSKVQL